ncbi:LysR family transcriptional regulator [Reinekea blandensis]|uniref:Transcriptional regulator, LysR family protein n=1 Tax=Reinekea blandensis MED297 TaxID=314283 RepID=A4BFW2_9GAMM|nr:LysR family transcriptional regulator [Reinekea blandensis]EAR08980.1 transcriptional regulator, LysR family protein [Reinekea sp. MED297] [Reinekea blandensis MED297]
MDTELLKTFLEVHQTRHFGRAAENLFLTQAAISARIKQLETLVGAPLFTRYRNNLQLTETGRRLLPHAQSIIIAWDRARQEVSLTQRNEIILSLGAFGSLWELFLQAVISTSFTQFNDVVLRADSLPKDTLMRRLLDRTLDLAFLYEGLKHSDITSVALGETELVFVTSNQNDPSLATALQQYVAVDWGTSFSIQFAKTFGQVPVILHCGQSRIAQSFLLAHEGAAYLPRKLVDEHPPGWFHPVEDAPVLSRPIFAAYHSENKYERQVRSIIDLAAVELKQTGVHACT